MKNLSIIFVFAILSNVASAHELEGQWEKTGIECSSGTSAKVTNDYLKMTEKLELKVSRYKIKAKSKISFKYLPEFAQQRIAELKNAIADIEARGSDEQKKSLSGLKSTLKETEQFAKGFNCTSATTSFYTLNESKIQTQLGVFTSTCPGESLSGQLIQETAYQIKDNILRVTNSKSELHDYVCPSGDSIVTLFERSPQN